MMPSNRGYVWIWLPGETSPVVAGKLTEDSSDLLFNYGQSYLERSNAITLYEEELPLKPGILPLLSGLTMPNCIRDAAPDAWGRRVLLNRLVGQKNDTTALSELTYLLESGSDRIGALDFQHSPTEYQPRLSDHATLDELMDSAARVEQGIPLSKALDHALCHGTSIGGARPKALITNDHTKYIAKFSSTTDLYPMVKMEFLAMKLAKQVGLNVAETIMKHVHGKDVLLIERFDRMPKEKNGQRRHMLSALTLFGLDEMMARYASYENLCHIIRHRFTQPKETLKELFNRLVFSILIGNTDDHARNHAAFWDGKHYELTPAYDLCPQPRTGNEASQAMLICGNNRSSSLRSCLEAASQFLLKPNDAKELIEHQIATIKTHWKPLCDQAKLTETDRNTLWQRQVLNPYVFE